MDAVKFIQERKRMCKDRTCATCPLFAVHQLGVLSDCKEWCMDHPEASVAVVEKWAEEHPRKTRQSEFLRAYPHAKIEPENGILELPPCYIEPTLRSHGSCRGIPCINCRKTYWEQEVE